MKVSITLLLTIGLLAGPSSVLADTKYFCDGAAADSNWSSTGNWEELDVGDVCGEGIATTIPTAADEIIIVSGKTCNVDTSSAAADHIEVESTATLNIETSRILTLDGTDDPTSIIDGTINLESGFGVAKLAFITTDQTLTGDGKIVGKHDIAEIRIEGITKLTSEITIEGQLKIAKNDTRNWFVNSGVVNANTWGTIKIETAVLTDTVEGAGEDARWQVSHSSATLLMDQDTASCTPACAMSLSGRFEVSQGTLDIDVATCTSGKLVMDGTPAQIDASDAQVTFSKSGGC